MRTSSFNLTADILGDLKNPPGSIANSCISFCSATAYRSLNARARAKDLPNILRF